MKRLNINGIRGRDIPKVNHAIWRWSNANVAQRPIVLNKAWVAILHPFLWEKPSEEENNENYEDEETFKKWNHIQYNDVLFPWEHEPYLIKIKYKVETKDLIFEREEISIFLDRVIDIDYCKKEIVIKILQKNERKHFAKKWNSKDYLRVNGSISCKKI